MIRRKGFGLVFLAVALVLGLAAPLLPADEHVAQAQTDPGLIVSLIEVDPLQFDEDVGTVRVGVPRRNDQGWRADKDAPSDFAH